MRFLNVQAIGLTGCPHIALHNILTTQDVVKLRAHLKFLCCDLLTGEQLARQQGGDANANFALPESNLKSTSYHPADYQAACRRTVDSHVFLIPSM